MSLPLLLMAFAFGAITASFIGVLAARLNTGQSFLAGRSRCDACAAELPPAALIPVLSYLMYGGRAGCCGTRLSSASPVAELALGGLFALALYKLGFSVALPFTLVSLSLLLALVLYDLAHQILPWPLLAAFVIASVGAHFALSAADWPFAALVALLIAGGLALVHALSRGRAMGLADAPLAFGLALLVGPQFALAGLVFSFWIGAAIGIILLARRPRGSRMGVEVPFAPYLAAGFLLAYFTQWNPFAYLAGLPSTKALVLVSQMFG